MAFKNGTGLVRFSYDLYEERVSIDLSGEGDDQCYRNDASVFFFCSNSYRTAYRTIERELKEDFSNRRDIKRILHLLLPYVFTFRQYYELELKALITSVSDEYPKTTHRVDALIDKLYVSAMDFKSSSNDLSESSSEKLRGDVINRIVRIKKLGDDYLALEPAVEYYRFIFEKSGEELELKNPKIVFDYKKVKSLFHSIDVELQSLREEMSKLGVYLFTSIM